jgi:hypothetical protein
LRANAGANVCNTCDAARTHDGLPDEEEQRALGKFCSFD